MKITIELDPITSYYLGYLGIMTRGWLSAEDILTPLIREEYHRVADLRKTTDQKGD